MVQQIKVGMLVQTDHSKDVYEVIAIRTNARGYVECLLDGISGWWSAWQLTILF